MKAMKYMSILFICLIVGACDDDKGSEGDEKKDRSEMQAWIEDTMRKHYFWYREIPTTLDYKLDEKELFKSMLSQKDGKKSSGGNPYSYIENTADRNTRTMIREYYSYGIEFTGIYMELDNNEYTKEIGALVLYVVPGSPADEAGLIRGDWILKIDNNYIRTDETYASLLGGPERTLYLARWDPNAKNKTGDLIKKEESAVLPAARAVIDNPIFEYQTITRAGKKVGYLVYNRFAPGIDDENDDETYDTKLREVAADFKKAGVTEMVLDLRYNNGGYISSAILLSSILAPELQLGNRLGYLLYNDKQSSPKSYFNFLKKVDLKAGAENLNLKKLYVLTSSATASASEMVINSLSPFMDVIVIGDKTEGKNVGSIAYPTKNEPYPYGDKTTTWVMHPIVSQISNSDDFTGYADGFVPGTYNKNIQDPKKLTEEGVYIDEAFDPYIGEDGKNYANLTETLPLGHQNERMLNVALRMIDGSYTRSVVTTSTAEKTYQKTLSSSITRKASGAVIIDIMD